MEGKPSKETPGGKKLVILHQHQPVRRKLLSNFSFLKKKSMNLKKKLYIMWLFILQKRNEKTFCRVKSRIILCVECYGAWLGAIFIFAFCESWKSRRSSLFSRDANKESLLWKLNGAQKLIEPEDTILSKSSKDIFYYNYYNILKMPFSWQEWIFSPEFT